MTRILRPAVSQSIVIQRVLYTASQLYNGIAMLLLFRCLVSLRTKLVFSQFYISLCLSLPSARPGHVLCWSDRWHENYVSLSCRSPRFKKQKVTETLVTNTKKFTAVLIGAFA